jgi:transcriptional regulator with XRE-family HTH domain
MVHKAKADQAQAEQFVRFVGERIRVLRSEKGITQEKLGELAGLNSNYIGQIERGEKSLSVYTLKKIAEGLGMSFEEMFRVINPMDKSDALGEIIELLEQRPKNEHELVLTIVRTMLSWGERLREK